MTTGLIERDNGWRIVLENCPGDYRAHAVAALAHLVDSGTTFTADDVRALIPAELEPHSPNVIGALIGSHAARKVIVPMGDYRSKRRTRHSSRNRVWCAS